MHFPVALKYVDPAVAYPPGWNAPDGSVQLSNATIQETWTALEDLVDAGLARSIGISNFQGSLILDLLRYARIRPATLQIEHHPYLVQPTLLQLAASEGIAVTAYSSFGPQSFIELDWQKAHDTPVLFEHGVVTALAGKYGKTPAQVLLRWATQRGLAVIPKSNNADRLKQNLDVTGFDLEKSELESISGLDRHLRFNNPTDVSLLLTFERERCVDQFLAVPRNTSYLCLGIDLYVCMYGIRDQTSGLLLASKLIPALSYNLRRYSHL